MSSTGTPAPDPAARVAPAPQPASPWRVVSVQAKPGSCLDVAFADGTAGEVRLQAFLEAETVTGTVFEALREPDVFAQARVELGAVTWPNGADLAPDAMYDAIRADGHWTVEA